MKKKTAVVLVNIGTPTEPTVPAVRNYLFRFLNDRRVIDLPWLLQKLLVNLIIVPFRAPKSTQLYQRLWTDKGSPLLYYGEELAKKLSNELGANYDTFLAMRYSQPYLNQVLQQVHESGYSRMVLLPLFPQYASSTTGSVVQAAFQQMKNWYTFPQVEVISSFHRHPAFIQAFAQRARDYNLSNYDHFVFSYHGLPKRQVDKVHPPHASDSCTCHQATPPHGRFCYKNAAFETTRWLRQALGISQEKTTIAFQSRLSNKWLAPFTDQVLTELAREGKKRVLVFSPSFVADCLETTVEIGYENKELFKAAGGQQLDLVSSLNADAFWAQALAHIIHDPHQELSNESLGKLSETTYLSQTLPKG